MLATYFLLFLSTPSARRATWGADSDSGRTGFLSTPSARRATYHEWYGRIKDAISIHALREEGDGGTSTSESGVNRISIHALREEGD